MSVWYIAQPNELLLDVDAYGAELTRGGKKLEMFVRRRLRDAVLDKLLDVDHIWIEPSTSPGNAHVFVRLKTPVPLMHRMIWQSWVGSDLFRARADLMRAANGHRYPSLLILPKRIGFRAPDDECACVGKHDINGVADRGECEVWGMYRGPSPFECFGRPRTKINEGSHPALPFGRRLRGKEWMQL